MSQNNERTEIDTLLQKPTEDLFVLLADNAGLGADEMDKESSGRTFFSRVWRNQKEAICGNNIVKLYIGDPSTSDATTIATQVLGLLIAVPGINMALIACLAVRIGLRKLCGAAEKNE